MSFINRILRAEHGRFFIYAVLVFLVFLLLLLFGSGNNLIGWMRTRREISRQERQIGKYREEIDGMNRQIESLSTDKEALEEFAREKFHFAAPGDDVYVVEE